MQTALEAEIADLNVRIRTSENTTRRKPQCRAEARRCHRQVSGRR
jgi:hypothetical protein